MSDEHPLLTMLHAAAEGRFPPSDGEVEIVPPYADHLTAVIGFTGHAVIAGRVSAQDARDHGADGFGGVYAPRVLTWLCGEDGRAGVLDVMLVRRSAGGPAQLAEQARYASHDRVIYARTQRRSVRVFGDHRGLVTLAEGVAGRCELSIEAISPGQGDGRTLLADAFTLVPADRWVFAAVSPGNARSLRAFLALGFEPIGSELIITHGARALD
jgi:hypothetical protein